MGPPKEALCLFWTRKGSPILCPNPSKWQRTTPLKYTGRLSWCCGFTKPERAALPSYGCLPGSTLMICPTRSKHWLKDKNPQDLLRRGLLYKSLRAPLYPLSFCRRWASSGQGERLSPATWGYRHSPASPASPLRTATSQPGPLWS